MNANSSQLTTPARRSGDLVASYPGFLWRALGVATDGSWLFYGWMTLLTAIALVGANAWAVQVRDGMIVTNMSDHVSWGLYIANFTWRNPNSNAALGRVRLAEDFGGGGVAEAFAGAVVEQGFDLANLLPGDALEARSFGKELTY